MSSNNDVLIVGAVRSPIGRRDGGLAGMHPVQLGATVLSEALKRTNISGDQVDFLVGGCISQVGEQALNVTRSIGLAAGVPIEVPAVTIDFQCGSSQQALGMARDMIASGSADLVVALGVESMTRVPMGSTTVNGPGKPFSRPVIKGFGLTSQGIAAENIAEKYGITRKDADLFALESHRRATEARAQGKFRDEIVPITVETEEGTHTVTEDETVRPDTNYEALSQLKPSFKPDGIHHAGNSSQICDGAAAVVLCSASKAEELGLKGRARVLGHVGVGSDPHLMLTGPITATPAVLDRVGLRLEDMDVIEINEAFASVVLAWGQELNPEFAKVNPNGGAIGLGHPLGATGVRLMTTLLHELERSGGRYGLETMCCGGGLATGTVIERID